MKLSPGWYAIADSREIGKNRPLELTRFGKSLVLWRKSNGEPVAMDDRCPHRFAQLSGGTIVDDNIVCPYHGFEFNDCGECTAVPETGKSAKNLNVPTYTVIEKHGFVWAWHGDQTDVTSSVPWFEELDSKFCYSQFDETWPCHITRCVENQLDYIHLPFVHKTTIGRFMKSPQIKVEFELSESRIKFSPSGKAFIEFLFPNVWRNFITDNFQLVLAFAPVSDSKTKLYLRSYYRFPKVPLLNTLIGVMFNTTNKKILNQDRGVVTSQLPLSSLDEECQKEALYPSDKAIKFYRETLQKAIDN